MDFDMRLGGDTLEDLAVTSDELLEASAAVGTLIDSVVEQREEKTSETVVLDEETESSSDEAEDGMHNDFEAQTQVLPGDDDDFVDEIEDDDNDVDMDDDYACTQVVDEDEEEEEEEEEDEENETQDVAAESIEEPLDDDDEEEEDEDEELVATQPASPKAAPSPRAPIVPSPKNLSPVKPAAVTVATEPQQPRDDESDATPLGRFSKVLGSVWDILERQGWQVAQGKDTLFCAMPGTQFFNFRPNINVFDSKDKACWKFIATSADVKDGADDDDSTKLWEILWDVAEKKCGWYTMACGPETWFVAPETRFEEFQPNETIFQTKKRAVLKCLALERVQVELGDSVDGHQVIAFAPKPVAPVVVAKVKKPAVEPVQKTQSTPVSESYIPARTPSPALKRREKKGPGSAAGTTTSVTKVSPSSTASTTTTPKSRSSRVTPPKAATKTGKKISGKAGSSASAAKRKGMKKGASSRARTEEKPLQLAFNAPEFKCTFGLVYKELQARGWYHSPGKFGYDYFSPEYTAATAIRNGNFFQSTAEFEEYIKDSGLWNKIESDLRIDHEEMVEQLRIEARKRMQKQQERKKMLETLKKQRQVEEKATAPPDAAALQQAAAKVNAQEIKQRNQEARQKAQEAKRNAQVAREKLALERMLALKAAKDKERKDAIAATLSFSNEYLSEFKITMGKIVKKLVMRGWCYRPGRFEYDYFKPGVQAKDAVLNEDYFQSVAELETYLKTSGLWEEIARELRDEHYAEQEREAMRQSQEDEEDSKRNVAQKRKSPSHAASSPALISTSAVARDSPKKARVESSLKSEAAAAAAAPPRIAAEEVEELTNDIWANSHHFEFIRR